MKKGDKDQILQENQQLKEENVLIQQGRNSMKL